MPGCHHCVPGAEEVCKACKDWYTLKDGRCVITTVWTIVVIAVSMLGVIGLAFALWYIDLRYYRSPTNEKGLVDGLGYRSRSRLHLPPTAEPGAGVRTYEEDGSPHELYPLATNLARVDIAGAGTTLHFSFQLAV